MLQLCELYSLSTDAPDLQQSYVLTTRSYNDVVKSEMSTFSASCSTFPSSVSIQSCCASSIATLISSVVFSFKSSGNCLQTLIAVFYTACVMVVRMSGCPRVLS